MCIKNAPYGTAPALPAMLPGILYLSFRLEKEDAEANAIAHGPLFERTGWVKAADSSLDDQTGFTLTSPPLPVDPLRGSFATALAGALQDEQLRALFVARRGSMCGRTVRLYRDGQVLQDIDVYAVVEMMRVFDSYR